MCLLGTTDNGASLCVFAYGVSGVSILATAVLGILQCCTCRLCGLGTVLDAIFAAAGTVLWAIAGVVFHYYGRLPAMAAVPRPEWRGAIPVLAFTACGLFGLMCLAAIWSVVSGCCCAGRSRGAKGARVAAKDVEGGSSGGGGGYAKPTPLPALPAPVQYAAQYAAASPGGYPAGYAAYYPPQPGLQQGGQQAGQFVVSYEGYWGTHASRF